MTVYNYSPLIRIKDQVVLKAGLKAILDANYLYRLDYASIFHETANVDAPRTRYAIMRRYEKDKDVCPVEKLLGPKPDATSSVDPEALGYHFKFFKTLGFAPNDRIDKFAWNLVGLWGHLDPDAICLNPAIMTRYTEAANQVDKTRILVIIYSIVIHELAHLLHYKIYHTSDYRFHKRYPNVDDFTEYGDEIEKRVFGGRIFSCADFSKLAIGYGDGKIKYELDPIEFHTLYFKNPDGERPPQIQQEGRRDIAVECEEWLSMGELNGTHERIFYPADGGYSAFPTRATGAESAA